MQDTETLKGVLYGLELLGTMAFAVSGALVAISKGTDLFGVLFLSMTTAVGGGVIRDIMIGNLPPVAFRHYEYMGLAALTGLVIFTFAWFKKDTFHLSLGWIEKTNLIFDAMGLGAFTVIGINAGILAGHGQNPFLVIFLGTLTGIGGGMARDLLVREIPEVLKQQVYAVASLIGGLCDYLLYRMGVSLILCALAGIAIIFFLRMLSLKFQWHLPKVELTPDQ